MGDITLGASLGGVAGGMLTWAVAGLVPVPTMLAVMAAFNVVCLLALSRLGPAENAREDTGERRTPRAEGTGPLSGLRVMNEVPYLRDLALIVLLGSATETLLDFVLSARATATFPAGAPLMSFFALFHTGIGWLGPGRADDAGPARAQAPGPRRERWPCGRRSVAIRAWSASPLPGSGARSSPAARTACLNNSLFRSGYELLFTPIAERRKRPTKAIVDVGFDRIGTVVGSVIILALAAALGTQRPRVLFALAAAPPWPPSRSPGACTTATSRPSRTACARAWSVSTWPT
jgi:hypothetical protein